MHRRAAGVLLGLMLVSCGQPYSNEDLVFLAALPEREQVEARVPEEGGVTHSGLSGSRTAQGLGEVSKLYEDTFAAGRGFNDILGFILGLLDGVRQVPPTTREEERRIWGPFPWERQPTLEGRVVIERTGTGAFTWDIEFRSRDVPDAPWETFVHGTAEAPEAQFRSSKGTVRFPVEDVAAAGMALGGLASFKQMDIRYDATVDPVVVHLEAVRLTGEGVLFTSRRFADGRGVLVFDLRQEWVGGTSGQDHARIITRWQADHRGRADVEILEGDGAGARAAECWGTDFRVTYQVQYWPLGLEDGDAASCIPAE